MTRFGRQKIIKQGVYGATDKWASGVLKAVFENTAK
jgi:hypothetical protein